MRTSNWYLCYMIAALYMIANVDRFIISIMVESIKQDLQLSDIQISLLIGFSFSIFFVVCGFWVARLADRTGMRRLILTFGAVFWSMMTAFSGLAGSFFQLLVARIGIGAGEATIGPCGQAMIAGRLRPDQLGRGMAIYTTGGLIGSFLAFAAGGILLTWARAQWPSGILLPVVGRVFSWQIVFLIVATPGMLLALLFWFTTREVPFNASSSAPEMTGPAMGFARRNRRVDFGMLGGLGMLHFGAGSATSWMPALLERKYGLAPDQTGLLMLAAFVIPGLLAAFGGGWVGDRLTRAGYKDAFLRASIAGSLLAIVPLTAAPLMPTSLLLTLAGAVSTLFGFAANPLIMSAVQTVTPESLRSTAAAGVTAAIVIIGYGFGPLVVALLTDVIFSDEQALDRSLAICIFIGFSGASLLFAWARQDYARLVSAATPAPGAALAT